MAFVCAYYKVSGPSYGDCYFLGQRYDDIAGARPGEMESWLISNRPTAEGPMTKSHLVATFLFTGVWRSDTKACFASDSEGYVHHSPDLNAEDADSHRTRMDVLPAPLGGVWGLSDDCVYTWGTPLDAPPEMRRWDGRDWQPMAAPDFDVQAVHGLAPDLLYAVGEGGGVARYDGSQWHRYPAPTGETLTSVFVASPDEMYAVGLEGAVLGGSYAGWGKVAEGPRLPTGGGAPLFAVAKWQDALWVGAGNGGLLRRVGTTAELECVKPNVLAVDFDARDELVVAVREAIVGTDDGRGYLGGAVHILEKKRAGKPLMEW